MKKGLTGKANELPLVKITLTNPLVLCPTER